MHRNTEILCGTYRSEALHTAQHTDANTRHSVFGCITIANRTLRVDLDPLLFFDVSRIGNGWVH